MSVRTGIGYDTHRLVTGRPLIIGGVEIPSELGLDGHSDADVLTHAVIDALLGACGLGDIGQHFPDTDPQFAGADSIELLKEAVRLVTEAGFELVNIDTTLVLQQPKLGQYREEIRQRLADAVGLELGCLNIKATTGESIGFVGRGEGAAAFAIATVKGTSA